MNFVDEQMLCALLTAFMQHHSLRSSRLLHACTALNGYVQLKIAGKFFAQFRVWPCVIDSSRIATFPSVDSVIVFSGKLNFPENLLKVFSNG